MKRVLISIAAILVFSTGLLSQKTNFGVKGGFDLVNNRYNPSNYDLDLTNRLSYDFGMIFNYGPSKLFQIQLETGFIEKGGKYIFNQLNRRVIYKYGYISNQFIFIIKPIKRINIEIGSELGYLVYAKQKERYDLTINLDLYDFKRFEVSSITGLSFNFINNTYLTFKYIYAFTPLTINTNSSDPLGGVSYSYKTFNKYFSIGLRYYFKNQ